MRQCRSLIGFLSDIQQQEDFGSSGVSSMCSELTRTSLKKRAMSGFIKAKGGKISNSEAVAFETGFNAGWKASKKKIIDANQVPIWT